MIGRSVYIAPASNGLLFGTASRNRIIYIAEVLSRVQIDCEDNSDALLLQKISLLDAACKQC